MTDTRWQIAVYIFVSIILRTVAAQLSRTQTGTAWHSFLREGWPATLLRFVYYIGLPYAALILGVLPARYLGLVGPDQAALAPSSAPAAGGGSAGWGVLAQVRESVQLVMFDWLPEMSTLVGLAGLMLIVLGLTWLAYGTFKTMAAPDLPMPGHRRRISVLQVVYQAVHWSFYRGAVWYLVDDLYLGMVGGILLVGAEWALDPGWRDPARNGLWREELLVDASVLTASAVMFFFVPNLWLLLPVHWLLAVASRGMVGWGERRVTGKQPVQRRA